MNGDGTHTAIEADCIHPLEAKGLMNPLNLVPSSLSHIDPYIIYLQFEVIPDSVEVSYWSEDCWDRSEEYLEGTSIPIIKTEDNDPNGNPITTYSFRQGKEAAIYEISAIWEGYDNFHGTANYSFYTTYPIYDTMPIQP